MWYFDISLSFSLTVGHVLGLGPADMHPYLYLDRNNSGLNSKHVYRCISNNTLKEAFTKIKEKFSMPIHLFKIKLLKQLPYYIL